MDSLESIPGLLKNLHILARGGDEGGTLLRPPPILFTAVLEF